MSVRCSSCRREFDVVLFEFDRWILCDCGTPVSRNMPQIAPAPAEDEGRRRMRELAKLADGICRHILDEDYPETDIAIERSQLRDQALRWFPDCEELFEMVYEARFQRLWQQWRTSV